MRDHLLLSFPLTLTLLLVDLYDWILHPPPILSIRAIACSPWSLCMPRDLAAFMHHPENLLVIRSVVHRKLLRQLVLSPQLLVHDCLVLLLVVRALISLVVRSAGSLLVRFVPLALVLGHSSWLLLSWLWRCTRSHAIDDDDTFGGVDVAPSVVGRPLRVVPLVRFQVDLLCTVVDLIVLDYLADYAADVVLVGELFEDGGDPVELGVAHVVVPTCARNGVLGLPQVRDRRVVDNDHVRHGAAQASEVLHKGIVELGAVFSEKFVCTETIWVELCNKRLCVFRQTRREDDKLVMLRHSVEKLADSRSHQNVDLPNLSLYLYRKHNIRSFDWLELRVHQCLVEVQHQGLPADIALRLWPD